MGLRMGEPAIADLLATAVLLVTQGLQDTPVLLGTPVLRERAGFRRACRVLDPGDLRAPDLHGQGLHGLGFQGQDLRDRRRPRCVQGCEVPIAEPHNTVHRTNQDSGKDLATAAVGLIAITTDGVVACLPIRMAIRIFRIPS